VTGVGEKLARLWRSGDSVLNLWIPKKSVKRVAEACSER
jgi:hypothetical protein